MPETMIGGGPQLPPRSGSWIGGKSTPLTTIGAQVKVDGLRSLEQALASIAKHSKTIRDNFDAINKAGRTGGSIWSKLGSGGAAPSSGNTSMPWATPLIQRGPQPTITAGAPQRAAATTGAAPGGGQAPPAGGATSTPSAGGSGGSTMPWLSRTGFMLSAVTTGANILSNRIGRNIAESAPISSQMALFSSMYSGMPYQGQEMRRFDASGRYGGTRQDQAATQALALRYGQTPQQATNFMSGIGNMVQAFGGTISSTQAASQAGGFLDPMVLRRQISSGMTPARVGGQVRNPMTVAQEYIKNYEQRRNGGTKLNEFDFINLQTPGSALRITFARLYGLDDASLDLISTAGMQTARAGGSLNYNSQAAIAGQLGMDRSKLGLQATSLMTTRGKREASFFNQNEGGMNTQLAIEETTQKALGWLEDKASSLTNTFAALDKTVKAVTAGFGLLFGVGMMGGMGGGGGIFGKLFGGGGAASAEGAPGAVTSMFGGGRGGGGGMSGLAAVGMAAGGAYMGASAIKTAVNANSGWDVLSAGGKGAAAGAMIGSVIPGVGTVTGMLIGGGAGLAAGGLGFLTNANDQQIAQTRAGAGVQGSNMSDKEIIEAFTSWKENDAPGWLADTRDWRDITAMDPATTGLIDVWRRRRSTLIAEWMQDVAQRDPNAFQHMMMALGKADNKTKEEEAGDWSDTLNGFLALSSADHPKGEDYNKWGEKLISMSRAARSPSWANSYMGSRSMFALYDEYFGGIEHPMRFQPIYTEKNYAVMDQFGTSLTDYVMGNTTQPTGDPTDTSSNTSNTANSANYSYVDRMPMAKPPDDSSWGGLDSRMKKRLLALFAASGGSVRLGGGGGTRSTEQQRKMFLDRHRVDPNGDITWDGKKWSLIPGNAAAAPPGRSMHEIGLAADLDGPGVGTWLQKNASRFGLKTFANVNHEPWHVQLSELPNSRREYEGGDYGATSTEDPVAATSESTPANAGLAGSIGASGLGGTSGGALSLGMSSLSILQGGAPAGGGGGGMEGTGGETTASQTADVNYSGSGPLTGKQMAQMLYNQGFRGDALVMALAISKRESGWDPSAYNPNRSTGDDSYGLFQINMLGDLGVSRRNAYGLHDNKDLLNPNTNIRVAWEMSQHGSNFNPWGGYKGMADNYNTDMDSARNIVASMHLGDASFDSGQVGTGGLVLPSGGVGRSATRQDVASGNGGGVHVHVTIQSTGNYTYDAQRLAKAARPALEAEYAEVSAKRNT